jgi:FkbM family methyltransferase
VKRWVKRVTPGFVWRALRKIRARYAAFRYRRMLRNYPRRLVEHDYGGFRLKITLADPDGAAWYDRDWPRLPEVRLLAGSRLRPGATVFNVGAHQGVVALMLAGEVGAAGRVVAVDPNPVNVELIETNAPLNGASQVRVVAAAVADRPGSVRFGVNLNDRVQTGPGAGGEITVPAVTVDQLAAEHGRPDVVFVDVEGFECAVLAGASGTLAAAPADWFVEVHVNAGLEAFGKTAADVLSFFPPGRYALLVASEAEREFVPLESGRHLLADRFFLVALDSRAGCVTACDVRAS